MLRFWVHALESSIPHDSSPEVRASQSPSDVVQALLRYYKRTHRVVKVLRMLPALLVLAKVRQIRPG